MTVSVVITTCDRFDFLKEAVDSVINQTVCVHQIILVDDGVLDSDKVRTLANDYKEIKYVKNNTPKGANYSRNIGIDLSESEFIAFMDDDDVWYPTKLSSQIKNLKVNNCSCSLVSFNYLKDKEIISRKFSPEAGLIDLNSLKKGNPYCGMSGLLVKKKVALLVKFDENLPCGQDWDYYIRIVQNFKCHYDDKPLLKYRIFGGGSITSKISNLNFLQFKERLRSAQKHYEFMGPLNYKLRIAEQTTKDFPSRINKLELIRFGVKEIGIIILFKYLIKDVIKFYMLKSGLK